MSTNSLNSECHTNTFNKNYARNDSDMSTQQNTQKVQNKQQVSAHEMQSIAAATILGLGQNHPRDLDPVLR